ncbi:MAG: hypothetical protein WBB69_14165 [Anaerolineales bacterium]
MGQQYEERTTEQIWEEWYEPYFSFVVNNKDVIRAVVYINTYWDSQALWGKPYPTGYWGDSRVQANKIIPECWLEAINQDF